jgi:hypothetical protein
MVCAAPWMFGAVNAWAELILGAGAGLVAVVGVLYGREPAALRHLTSAPSLALGGLVGLALFQATPIPERLLRKLDPSTAALRASLQPGEPERVAGDDAPPVGLAPPTLSQAPGMTLETAGRLASTWLLFQGVIALGRGFPALRQLGWAVAINGAVLALFSLVQSLSWNGKIYWTFPTTNPSAWSVGGPFANHSHLAEYLNVGLAFALAVLLAENLDRRPIHRTDRVWAAYLAGVLALGVITSHSRGGFVAMLVVLVATLVVAALSAWGAGGPLIRKLTGLGVAGAVLAVLLWALGNAAPYGARLSTLLDPRNEGYAIRDALRRDSLSAWRSHPLLGTGLGTFSPAAAPFSTTGHTAPIVHAECEPLELLVEGGVVGLGLALCGLAGLVRAVRRAWVAAGSDEDRALVVAACAGPAAVLLQCLGDYGLHVPAVATPLVVASAHLCALGVTSEPTVPARRLRPRGRVLAAAVLVLPATLVILQGVRLARAEAWLCSTGVLVPDTATPTAPASGTSPDALGRQREALEHVIRLRSGWPQGYLRLGMTELALYQATVRPGTAGIATAGPRRRNPGEQVRFERDGAARGRLIPAARHFLAARRCCLVVPRSHLELSDLSFLLEPRGPAATHIARGLLTAGGDGALLRDLAGVALRSGDTRLASACWNRSLRLSDTGWQEIADEAARALPPDRILGEVLPPDRGHLALWFADRIAAPADRELRGRLLRVAADRLPSDSSLSPAERLWLEAQALSGLGERAKARERFEGALALRPGRADWRREWVERLLAWGDLNEAHRQAVIAAHLAADRPELKRLVERTAEALARGSR